MKLVNGFHCLLLLFLVPILSSAATDVSGIIEEDTTWTEAGSPYSITGLVQIPYNATLTIEPGVRVVGNVVIDAPTLEVEGQLIIAGSAENFVEIDGPTITNFGSNSVLDVSYAKFGNVPRYQRNIDYFSGTLNIRDSIFDNYPGGISIGSSVTDSHIERNVFTYTEMPGNPIIVQGVRKVTSLGGIIEVIYGGNVYIRNNYFDARASSVETAILLRQRSCYLRLANPPRNCNWSKPDSVIEYNSFSETLIPKLKSNGRNESFIFAIQNKVTERDISVTHNYWGTTDTHLIGQMIKDHRPAVSRYLPALSDHHPDTPRLPPKSFAYLQTTSTSQNISYTHILNTADTEQTFLGTIFRGGGYISAKKKMPLGEPVPPMGRLSLNSEKLEEIFGIDPWSGPAMLSVEGEGAFALMTKLTSPSGLVSNTNCVREDRVLNIEGFDSNNMSYVRLINTWNRDTGEVRGALYDSNGHSVGNSWDILVENLSPYQQVWMNRTDLADKFRGEWDGEALLEVSDRNNGKLRGVKLLNLNYITDEETFFNFSCFEDSTSGRVYLQTTSTSQNVSATHLVNTSDVEQQLTGTLYGSDGSQVGSANQPLHSGTIPSKGRVIISSEDIESAFNISPWSGPAMLEVSGTDSFELMTKLTSPSGLISNTNCVRQDQVHNIGGFDQTDVTYVRFINIGDTPITNISGSLYDTSGNVVGASNPVLIDELPSKAHVWLNRNQLSDLIGDTWNGTASLKIDNADSNLRLLNLKYINSETFFNFSCYERGQ